MGFLIGTHESVNHVLLSSLTVDVDHGVKQLNGR